MTVIAVDFDGTVVEHIFPLIGPPVPGAFQWLKEWQKAGAQIILWTCRGNIGDADYLTEAIDFCRDYGFEFNGVNLCLGVNDIGNSPKIYADLYVDDRGFGCPLLENPRAGGRPYVDWDIVGPGVLQFILSRKEIGWDSL